MLAIVLAGDDPLGSPAAKTLLAIGPKAIPALQKAISPNQGFSMNPTATEQIRHNAQAVIAALRGQAEPKDSDGPKIK